MERFKDFWELSFWFGIMGILSVIKNELNKNTRWNVWKSISKLFINIITGLGFYTFLLSYKDWYGEYPQKIGVIMFVTYIGSRLIDLLVDKILEGLKRISIKEIFKF